MRPAHKAGRHCPLVADSQIPHSEPKQQALGGRKARAPNSRPAEHPPRPAGLTRERAGLQSALARGGSRVRRALTAFPELLTVFLDEPKELALGPKARLWASCSKKGVGARVTVRGFTQGDPGASPVSGKVPHLRTGRSRLQGFREPRPGKEVVPGHWIKQHRTGVSRPWLAPADTPGAPSEDLGVSRLQPAVSSSGKGRAPQGRVQIPPGLDSWESRNAAGRSGAPGGYPGRPAGDRGPQGGITFSLRTWARESPRREEGVTLGSAPHGRRAAPRPPRPAPGFGPGSCWGSRAAPRAG